MSRPLILVLIATALLSGCSGPSADEIAAANLTAQKHDAQITRIKKFSKKGDSDVKRYEEMYMKGDIADWAKMRPYERAMVCVFPIANETEDDRLLCIAASMHATVKYDAIKSNGGVTGVPAKDLLATGAKEQVDVAKGIVQLLELGSLPDEYRNAVTMADAMRPR